MVFHGAPDEWNCMEMPLLKLDPEIEQFAKKHKLSLSKNYHDLLAGEVLGPDGRDCQPAHPDLS
jgi:hypothetical protein